MASIADPPTSTNVSLPPELDVFLDFIADDDRPTFILEQSTTPRVVFRNSALDTLVQETSHNSLFLNWIETLSIVAGEGSTQELRRIESLGRFASRDWSSKRVGYAWTAVFCSQDCGTLPLEQPDLDGTCIERLDTEQEQNEEQQGIDALEWQSAGNTSSSQSNAFTSPPTSELDQELVDVAGPLDDLVVGWLSFPHLTPDPWIRFLSGHDWDKTATGPMRTWHPTLHQIYTTILSSREPRVLYWGPDLLMFYNAAARPLVGEMHPFPLGNPLADVWGIPMHGELTKTLRTGIKRGKPLHNERREFVITRNGFPESCFFDFLFASVPNPDGRFAGFVNEFTDVTESVLQENRYDISKSLLDIVSKATSNEDLWKGLVSTLDKTSKDVLYAVVYTYPSSNSSGSSPGLPRLQAASGIEGLGPDVPLAIITALQRKQNEVTVLQQRKKTLPLELAVTVPDVGVVNAACVLPVTALDSQQLSAIVVLGWNPLRPIDASSFQFAESLRGLMFKSSALFSLPSEQRRAQELSTSLSQQLEIVTTKAEKSEQNLTIMVHNAPIGMIIYRLDGYPVYVNDKYLDLLGLSRAEFYNAAESGFAWRSAIFDDDFVKVSQTWTAAVESKTPVQAEFRVKSNSPSGFRWLEATVQQRFDEGGNILFLYSWLTDVSSSKLTEFLTEQRLADALETKRSSENFIDMISHEIRNPLSAILQLADNILLTVPSSVGDVDGQPSVLTADERHTLVDAARTIVICAHHQKGIIDEVLTFSKLDSKLLMLAPERVRPPAIIQSVLKMVEAELDHADIRASINIKQNYLDLAVDHVLVDPGRLSQVIINLMTNAIKFTKSSSKREIVIDLAASQTRPTANDCQVMLIEPREISLDESTQHLSMNQNSTDDVFLIFSVRDSGCGLTEDDMKHLFHRFRQASPKTYTQYGGSGLGLFISKELVELQGGQIGVHGESGQGSTFAFYVRATRAEPGTSKASLAPRNPICTSTPMHPEQVETPVAPTTKLQDLHVLVVEDNDINQKVISQQLKRLGVAKVHVAGHGLDALNLLSTTTFHGSIESGKIPLSVVLLDVEMPIMDGLTCARRIRELEKTRIIIRHVPIIGITANARTDQLAQCIEAGMDEVVTKPFRLTQDVSPRMLALVDKYNLLT